jgi:hypothetical protein
VFVADTTSVAPRNGVKNYIARSFLDYCSLQNWLSAVNLPYLSGVFITPECLEESVIKILFNDILNDEFRYLQSNAKMLIMIECSGLMEWDAASLGKCFAFRRNVSLTSQKGTEPFLWAVNH